MEDPKEFQDGQSKRDGNRSGRPLAEYWNHQFLWIGSVMGPNLQREVLKLKGSILSSQTSQTNLIAGLDAIGVQMDTLNAAGVSERLMKEIQPEVWSRNGNSTDIGVGYRNIVYANRLLRQRALRKAARQWVLRHGAASNLTVFVYEMVASNLSAARQIKKLVPGADVCLIVPDLPQFMDSNPSRVKRVLKKLDWVRIKKLLDNTVDKYVLYSEPMAGFLGLRKGQWTVVEGACDGGLEADADARPSDDGVSVMYSGALGFGYGLEQLLNSLEFLGPEYQLWFSGGGEAAGWIMERAKRDSRIKYLGFLPTTRDLLNRQARSTMLISLDRTKYCFPSKLFEYMQSGRPVLSSKSGGIPKEYFDYLIPLEDSSAKGIAQAIERVGSMPEELRQAKGEQGKSFVLREKNNVVQARRILDFVM